MMPSVVTRPLLHSGWLFCCILMFILYPSETLKASQRGLTVWWVHIVPALFPFLIVCDALVHIQTFRLLGHRLAPFFQRVYRLPTSAGWAMVTGFALGSPLGTKTVIELRQRGDITREQGIRLLAICDLCSPLWILSVIGTAGWQQPIYGIILICFHMITAVIAGLLCNFFILHGHPLFRKKSDLSIMNHSHWLPMTPIASPQPRSTSIGQVLGTSIQQAFSALLTMGGWMILASVAFEWILLWGQWQPWITTKHWPMLAALIDLNLGVFTSVPLTHPSESLVLWMSVALGWGGWSLHAQVRSLLRSTDLPYAAFVSGRLTHALLSIPCIWIGWSPIVNGLGLQRPETASIYLPPPTLPWTEQDISLANSVWMYGLLALMVLTLFLWGISRILSSKKPVESPHS